MKDEAKKIIPVKLKETLVLKRELKELNDGKDLLDNYGWREYAMWDALRNDFPTLDLLIGRSGPDFECPESHIYAGEMKSNQFDMPKRMTHLSENKGKGEFDKQTDPIRRKETLCYDGFLFGLFLRDEYIPVVLLYINTVTGVNDMRNLLKSKQKVKIQEIVESKNSNKKTPRDSIVITFKDIYDNLLPVDYLVYFNGQRMDTSEYLEKLRNQELDLSNL